VNCKSEVKKIRTWLKRYTEGAQLKSLVLGVSGGVDSALVAALAYHVCNKELGIPLVLVSLPSKSNKPDELKRARDICRTYSHRWFEAEIDSEVELISSHQLSLLNIPNEKIRKGNVKARVRMIHLYNTAFSCQGAVLSTDNLTEYLLGFWTLHGDVGDIAPIQHYWKTEVYQLAQWIVDNEGTRAQKRALQACIKAVPTDGLGITNSDLDQLGASSYAEVDKILKSHIWNGSEKYKDHIIIKRWRATHFKRNNPCCYLRLF